MDECDFFPAAAAAAAQHILTDRNAINAWKRDWCTDVRKRKWMKSRDWPQQLNIFYAHIRHKARCYCNILVLTWTASFSAGTLIHMSKPQFIKAWLPSDLRLNMIFPWKRGDVSSYRETIVNAYALLGLTRLLFVLPTMTAFIGCNMSAIHVLCTYGFYGKMQTQKYQQTARHQHYTMISAGDI